MIQMHTKLGSHGEMRCVALDGELMKNVTCTYYENRPNVCRKFERGSRKCVESVAKARLLTFKYNEMSS